ncbi:MAG: hypothetical protein KAT37_04055 [Candidatus Aenigmarchaeota archaeon]|nr:hypothetical protein [Candidatus Aenigmarchaeota archaeon]
MNEAEKSNSIFKIHVFREGIPITQFKKRNIMGTETSFENRFYLNQISARTPDYIAESKNYIAQVIEENFYNDLGIFAGKIINKLKEEDFNPTQSSIILDFNVPPYYAPHRSFKGKYWWSPEGNLGYAMKKKEQENFRITFKEVLDKKK